MQLYAQNDALGSIDGFTPLLAQWEKSTHPAQVRLHEYLNWIKAELSPVCADQTGLSLHLEVAVSDPSRLLVQCDLENYLTPLFGRRCLEPARFVLVSAEKRVGGSSRISIGTVGNLQLTDDWCCLQCMPRGTVDSKQWRESIRAEMESSCAAWLPPGPVEAHFAFRCSRRKNWITPWKPAGDALGPVLGYVNPQNPYHPLDDRIVRIGFHRNVDEAFGNRIEVGVYWRSAPSGAGPTMRATPRTTP